MLNKQMQMDLDNQRSFLPEPQDIERWSNHKKLLFEILKDKKWHSRNELVARTNTSALTARISDLRKLGYEIHCVRTSEQGTTAYRIVAYIGKSTTQPVHCYCCRFNDDYIPTDYTG
tara:strand:- start:1840 stop:2190 length:351 start_codon:yes stop_codon:yes gene_type:complete